MSKPTTAELIKGLRDGWYGQKYLDLAANKLEEAEAKITALEAENKALREALNDLLNDCINFDGGKLTDCIMTQATKALEYKT